MVEKDLKLVKNNFIKFETAINKQNAFLNERLKETGSFEMLSMAELNVLELLGKISKNVKSINPGNASTKAKSCIKMLHYVEDLLITERGIIKGQKDVNDIIFSFDAILKRSVMRTRKLVERLTYNL